MPSPTIPDGVARFQPDVGPAKIHARTTAGSMPLSGKILVDGARAQTLLAFYELAKGDIFLFENPFTDELTDCRFMAPPGPARPMRGGVAADRLWEFPISLEVMP